MNDANRHVLTLFAEVLEAGAPEAQAAYLDRACDGDSALRSRLEALLRAHREAGGFLGGEASTPDPVVTIDEPTPCESSGTVIGPYKLLQQIGEGGMGTVYMAEQSQPVRRMVALKIIKPGMDSKQVIARFEAERQALALMDHPNIAKVLDAGTTEGGRPYFVMELVKGGPITKYCDEHRLTPKQRLELFVPVCQAVQHAHQKGIIHRDLKPSNVMVCLYDGKPVPKVIDFGVAKATGQKLTERTMFTEIGQVVGTLEYMSPEQAELNQLDIDTRSDIYSLGVLLYELLTGTTPLEKKGLRDRAMLEVLRLIREEEPPKPSTRLSTTDEMPSVAANRSLEPKKLSGLVRGDLDWIAMQCLEKDRNRRYETANGLAADVQRYLADEPVLACPPSAAYRWRKFARRHKAGLRIAAATALVLLLAVGGVSWALWDQAARRTELSERMAETERTVSAALIQTEQWRKQAGEAPSATIQEADAVLALWRQAEASLAQAETALRTGTADDRLRQRVLDERQHIGQQLAQALRTANLLRDLDDARMTGSNWLVIETHFDFAGASTKYAAAFAAYGLELKPGRTQELARRIRAEQPAIREALIVALDDLYKHHRPANLGDVQALAAAADDDPWRRKYRAAATAKNATALRALSSEARRLSLPTSSLYDLAVRLRDAGDRDEALALLRWARGRHLTDFWIHFELGSLLQAGTDKSPAIVEETIGCYRTCLGLRPAALLVHARLVDAMMDHNRVVDAMVEHERFIALCPDNSPGWNAQGVSDSKVKRWDKAIADFSKAIEQDPKNSGAHLNLGIALSNKNQLDEAMAEYRKAIDLDPNLALAHYNLGTALRGKKDVEGAIRAFQAALRINPHWAEAHCDLGITLCDQEDVEGAIREYQAALKIDPNLANAHLGLGTALRDKGDVEGAIREYQAALRIKPHWAEAYCDLGITLCDKKDVEGAIREYQAALKIDPNLANAHYGLGNALRDKGDVEGAIRAFQAALRINPNFAEAHNNLGNLLHVKKDVEGAIREYQAALKIDPNLANAHYGLGNALRDKKDVEGAIREYQAALKIDPNLANAHYGLGSALRDKGDVKGAIREYQAALKIDPNLANAHNGLGNALKEKNQLDEASAEFRKAIELDPKYAMAHYNLGVVLQAKNQLDEAMAEYRQAIDLDPKYAPAHNNLGNVLTAKNQLDEAIAEFRKAIELNPKLAMAHTNLGSALAAKNQLDEASAEYRKAIELDPKSAPAHCCLGIVLEAKNQLDEASAEYRKAIDLQPDYAEAHCNLAGTLRSKGQLSASLDFYKRGHALGSKRKDWRNPSAQWVADAERLVRLEAKLPDVLAGKATPTDNRERLGLLEVCGLQRRHVAVARLYADAFTADPKLADDLTACNRYNAACAAALAAAGQGTDAGKLDDMEHIQLRQQALAWLRADLDLWSKRLQGGKPEDRQLVRAKLEPWQRDTDLAGVRDAAALQKLSAEEQEAWRKLWADVAELLKK